MDCICSCLCQVCFGLVFAPFTVLMSLCFFSMKLNILSSFACEVNLQSKMSKTYPSFPHLYHFQVCMSSIPVVFWCSVPIAKKCRLLETGPNIVHTQALSSVLAAQPFIHTGNCHSAMCCLCMHKQVYLCAYACVCVFVCVCVHARAYKCVHASKGMCTWQFDCAYFSLL